jgi:PHS family inorganic phosphate transporter-like MFS transporter
VLILAFGAIASAFAPNYTFLLVSRVILGIGIGGDYPVSATIMSEYSGKQTRGRMVGLVFAMQGAGLIVGPLVASILLGSGVSNNLTWRILLGLGAIPGLAVFYLRRQIHETPRFAAAGGAHEEAEAAIGAATGTATAPRSAPESKARNPQSALGGFMILTRSRRMLLWLIGTAGCWALLDFCYYGNTISTPEILKLLNPHASLLHNTLVQLGIFVVFAVPGYVVAILLLDKSGRRSIQILGFGMMALMFLLIGIIPSVTTVALQFLLLYGISYFFTEFGPNTTTFIYPAEIFPVEVRTTGHGISAGAGKLGAFAGAFLFPDMLASSLGVRGAEIVAGVVAVAGMLLTIALLPEPKGKTLEELSADAYAPRELKLETAR